MTSSGNSKTPIVSVVLAAHNADAFIARAIKSVQSQTLQEWELICTDDGSSDGTAEIIRNVSSQDSRVKLISQDNSGPAEARRKGYMEGRGEYFIMLDADDWLATDALEKLVCDAQRVDADFTACRAMISENGLGEWTSFHEQRGTPQGVILTGQEAFALTFPWKIHGIGLWRHELIKKIAVLEENAFNCFNADEYLTRLLMLNCKSVIVGSGEYYIFPNRNSITRKRSWRQFLALQTDRKLTELAIDQASSSSVIHAALLQHRQDIIMYAARFARFGGGGKAQLMRAELCKSMAHYLRVGPRYNGAASTFSIIPSVLYHSTRAFMGRSAFLRDLFRRIRPIR